MNGSLANEIYINQVGHDTDIDIVQDGADNKVRSLSTTSGDAVLSGNDKVVDLTQTGDNNRVGIWSSGTDQIINITQNGNSNISRIDNHGNNNDIAVNITGNSNVTHTEIGNGGDDNNNMNLTIDGDSNNAYVEVLNGDSNNVDVQIHKQDSNIIRVTVNGTSNNVKAYQGKHEDGSIDADETGDNEGYWIVSGNSNNLASYQTDDNSNGGQHFANYITGSNNTVKLTQRGASDHRAFVEIGGDDNTVELLQRGNSNVQFADIVLDDGHSVDVHQRYADHTANIDLTNGGGAYNLDLTQNAYANQTYNMTGTCTNALGCGVSVVQN
mgnify:FL=1